MALFNVSGQWRLKQSNGFTVLVDLRQNSTVLSGRAQVVGGTGGEIRRGDLTDTNIHFVVFWDNGSIGDYAAVFGSDTRLRGSTFDVNDPGSQATWHSEKQFQLL